MSRALDTPQKEGRQLAQGRAGHDCTQATHLLLGLVATARPYAFSLQPLSAHSEVTEIPHPSATELEPLV